MRFLFDPAMYLIIQKTMRILEVSKPNYYFTSYNKTTKNIFFNSNKYF